jgi:hypothetical protein
VPPSVPESQALQLHNIGIREMEGDKFNRLCFYAKVSVKSKSNEEKPHLFIDLFLLLCPGDWKKQLQQMNEPIEREFKRVQKKSRHKHSVRHFKPIFAYDYFDFLEPSLFLEL